MTDEQTFAIPKHGTLERLILDKLLVCQEGVSYLDFVGTEITQDNIDKIISNLKTGMFEQEDNIQLQKDA